MSHRFYLITVVSVACLHILYFLSSDALRMQWSLDGAANDVPYDTPSILAEMTTLKPEWDRQNPDNVEMNQAVPEGVVSTPNQTYHDKLEINQVASEGDVRNVNSTYNDNTEADQVAPEGDVNTPSPAHHTNAEKNRVSFEGDVKTPNGSPAEDWEKLWRDNIEAHSSATHNIEVHSNESDKLPLKERKRRLEMLLSFNSTLNGTSAKERGALTKLFDVFPSPKHKDSVALYSENAYNKLISKLLLSQEGKRKFKIVATGGSTTAGGGKPAVAISERYFGRFADYLKNLLSIDRTGIEYLDQGHGTRNSLHAAALFDNFIPSDTDLLIWEFSINDAADPDLKNKEKILDTSRQSFIAWLHEVSNREQPPLVMLVYYWDSPFHRNKTTRAIIGNSFESNGDIARQFEFVVGHVNMATYVDDIQLPKCGIFRGCPLVSDRHHASKLGHAATAFLLLNLLSPYGTFRAPASNRKFTSSVDHLWECGIETEAKKVLKNVITNSPTGWKSPIGSWTLDFPVSEELSSTRRLQSTIALDEIEVIGKGVKNRQDRQRVTPLKFCGSEKPFSLVAPSKPMKDVRVMFLSFQAKVRSLMTTADIRIQINDSNATAPGELVPMLVQRSPEVLPNWPCHFACSCGWGNNVDLYWYVFESVEPAVHSVRICANPGRRKTPKIQSIVFW